MEHAIWIKETGEDAYVSIKEVKVEIGEDAARRKRYKCPSNKCGVKMITVFPKRIRSEGKEAHSDHFRAFPEPHTQTCGGDGEREDVVDNQIGCETDARPRYQVVTGGDYPRWYVKRARLGRGTRGGTGTNVSKGSGRDERTTTTTVAGIRNDIHTSAPETGHIRRIVEAYENPPEERSRMELNLPDCPAKNYEDGFRDVDQAIDTEGNAAGTYIYKGDYHTHHVSADNAITIIFSQLAGDGRNLSVLIGPELEPDAAREEIKKLLVRAAHTEAATVYVFGRFQPFEEREYSVRMKAFGDLWVTFPA